MSASDLRNFYGALHDPHLRRFFLLGLGTGALPDAVKSMTWPQVDVAGRSIALNPPGRLQTKKRRAVVPICSMRGGLLATWRSEGPVVHSGASPGQRQNKLAQDTCLRGTCGGMQPVQL